MLRTRTPNTFARNKSKNFMAAYRTNASNDGRSIMMVDEDGADNSSDAPLINSMALVSPEVYCSPKN